MALSRHHGSITEPRSVEQIVSIAREFDYSPDRPLRSWLRAAQMLITQAAISERDGDIQTAYLYLYRHAELVIGKLSQHPGIKDPKYKAEITQAQRTVQKNLAKLEEWKPRINRDYERYVKAVERRNAEKQRVQAERLEDERQRLSQDEVRRGSAGSEEAAFPHSPRTIKANENRQLAVDLAHRELRRRDASRQSTRQAGISPHTVAARRRGFVLENDEPADDTQPDPYRVSDSIQKVGRHLRQQSLQQSNLEVPRPPRTVPTAYHYPSVPSKESALEWDMPTLPSERRSLPNPPPALPAKEAINGRAAQREPDVPPLPPKALARDSAASTPSTATPSPPPTNDSRQSKYMFTPDAFTESGAPLRPVFLPPDLRKDFLNLAHPNTMRNLETCGILCGTLISNALFISHLIIPDQQSTSDTCDTTEEGDNELFDFCDAHELLVCGWIHTHPSQSCFLSSRDLHTSSGYQVMLPEAIAIVCAPRQNPDWGIFRLTDPPGLNHILSCQQRSLFHPHSETNLYTDAIKPGHVVEGPGLKFEVVDLRKK